MIATLTGPNFVIDGSGPARSFVLPLTAASNVTAINLVPGRTYKLQIEQDATGGHPVTWFISLRNPAPIAALPNGKTNLAFIALDDGVGYLSRSGVQQ